MSNTTVKLNGRELGSTEIAPRPLNNGQLGTLVVVGGPNVDEDQLGDVHKEVLISVKQFKNYGEFTQVWLSGLAKLRKLKLKHSELKLALVILEFSEYNNRVALSRKQMGELAELNPSQTSRAFQTLKKLGVIECAPIRDDLTNNKYLFINEAYAWRGKQSHYATAVKDRRRRVQNALSPRQAAEGIVPMHSPAIDKGPVLNVPDDDLSMTDGLGEIFG